MKISLTRVAHKSSDAQTLIFIHGMGSAATAWKTITPTLSENYHLISVDLPGHGLTPLNLSQPMDPRSLAELVVKNISDEYGIDTFHVIGNSLGGWIGLEMASLFPEQVQSVTAIAPAGLWLVPFTSRAPGSGLSRTMAQRLKNFYPTLMKYQWARQAAFYDVSPRWRSLSYDTCLDATMAMATSTGYFPAWDAMLTKRFDSTIASHIPICIIFGDTDRVLPKVRSQEKTLAPDHATWHEIASSGHAPMWDSPELVISYIRQSVSAAS